MGTMKILGLVKKTGRGFELIEFCDYNGDNCSLQASSLAIYEKPGTSAIWLGCEKNAPVHLGHELSPRMHLSYKQVQALVSHLQNWLENGSFKKAARNSPRQSRRPASDSGNSSQCTTASFRDPETTQDLT
jgi:hypothetical protein